MKNLLMKIVELTRPVVWKIARAYSFEVSQPPHPTGQNELVFLGTNEQVCGQIPRSCYFNTRSGKIVIGNNCVFGENVMVLTGKHLNHQEAIALSKPLHDVPESGRDILIGEGCYIGSGAIIIGPVEIGDFAVIGAGAVVTRNVPSRSFAAGNPARLIRQLQ
jgi:acetyltransferase-like isoleucine patch superfamily enzyme